MFLAGEARSLQPDHVFAHRTISASEDFMSIGLGIPSEGINNI